MRSICKEIRKTGLFEYISGFIFVGLTSLNCLPMQHDLHDWHAPEACMSSLRLDATLPYVVDLTTCDREPVHHIGAIQSVGFLIAFARDWRVSRLSANAFDFLGKPVSELLGMDVGDIFQPAAVSVIRGGHSSLLGSDAVERSFAVQLRAGGPCFDLAIHETDNLIVIEAEPSVANANLNAGAMVRSMLN